MLAAFLSALASAAGTWAWEAIKAEVEAGNWLKLGREEVIE